VETINLPSHLPSALQVLTALIAPALLISASASFVLSTSTRLANNANRARAIAAALKEWKHRDTARSPHEQKRLKRELRLTYHRVYLERQALALFYAATIMFVACSLVLGLEAIVRGWPYWLPVVLGLFGVVLLLIASALLIVDLRSMAKLVRHEVAAAGVHGR
jgi:hypothetical protein